MKRLKVAIIDLTRGNLFSVKLAFEKVGIDTYFVRELQELREAQAVVIPGVGAFGQAMKELKSKKLDKMIINLAQDVPVIGICLGMQLLFSSSEEFGNHEGLNLIPGKVKRLPASVKKVSWGEIKKKVPHIGWNIVSKPNGRSCWNETLLKGIQDGSAFYFMHSYFVEPSDRTVITGVTKHGDFEFCSAVEYNNIKAFQFHPERSGEDGLTIYRNIAEFCNRFS